MTLSTDLKSFITKVTTPSVAKPVEVAPSEPQPKSTFSLKSSSQEESKARDNVDLPYFIGENTEAEDKINGNFKSKLFTVDEEDRLEVSFIFILKIIIMV